MADKSLSVEKENLLPEYCQRISSDKIVCVKEGKELECVAQKSGYLSCGPEEKICKIINKDLACEHIEYMVPVVPEGKEMKDVFIGHAYLVVIAAILSLALTQIVKPFIFKTCNEKSDAVIRLFAVLTGAGIAYSLSDPFDMIDVYMGASAGAINAFVIKMFKLKVKKSLGVEEGEEEESEESETVDEGGD